MEEAPPKTLERVISQKAFQMSSSFPCQVCVLGFLCGVCVTYFSLAALGSFTTADFGALYASPSEPILQNSTPVDVDVNESEDLSSISKNVSRGMGVQRSTELVDEERVLLLYSAWSSLLNGSDGKLNSRSSVPDAPHLENCKLNTQLSQHHDNRGENGSFPPWTTWKGWLGLKLPHPIPKSNQETDGSERQSEEANTPWISGSDAENIPLTRKVQHDIWVHQHPQNCNDPQLRFLVADWESLPGFGIGAQIAAMCGLLAIAINEKRILVTNYYNRADHDGCKGPSQSRWSCYFFRETSKECQDRAFKLVKTQEAWDKGFVTRKENYTTKEIWTGRIPGLWGSPWSYMQPTTEIKGILVTHHRKMDQRWWRAQAVRYLMRFQSEYTCHLLNIARHEAFGMQAARMVIASAAEEWPETPVNRTQDNIEQLVWSSHKPWTPRPILSMHVRMGDKASEMKVVGFELYMSLAERIRRRFPNLNTIWLSTEMQEVIDQTRLYPHWNFYYTKVARQFGKTAMATYEASLGRETGTNYPITNFLMATEADFFIGALGSTWCHLIDGMRNTGGKVMAGYLSVNKDRFW